MSTERPDEVIVDTSFTTIHTVGSGHDEGRQLCFMHKDGRFHVAFHRVPRDWSPYLLDIFTTLVEIRWRVMLLVFSLSYIISWLFFGLCYWLIAYAHGDVDVDSPCVLNVYDFTSAFLFSMETQATIGYGFRGMTENCTVAVAVVTIQDVISCLLDTIVIGIVIAKMASARKRAQTVGFSRYAVVNRRDGALCLSWRLGDFRGNHILEGVARAQLIRHSKQSDKPVVISYQDLDIQERELALATPAIVVHKLDPGSPLYSIGPDELLVEDFELVVSFTYTGDSTGMLHQTRTTYTPADIRWAQRFQEVLEVGKKHYKVDYALFNEITWVATPMLSAEQFDRGKTRPGLLVKRGRRCMEEVTQQTHL